ncbi:hypothetical protein BJ912DRAFT_1058911 [Pholiota molesta]|nr:hypothetical protein BJ912DRAFT_1058911 [Pholiota molesta]
MSPDTAPTARTRHGLVHQPNPHFFQRHRHGPGADPQSAQPTTAQQQMMLPEQEMQRQVEEYKRSVTIIIWYKANAEPLRLHQFLPTFPYFQLSNFSNVIDDLGLTPSSYLDTYIPNAHQWEQHTISVVRIVETQQRLIYKVRRSLMDSLAETDCPSLREELQMQGRSIHSHNGRGGSTLASPAAMGDVDSKLSSGEGSSAGDHHTKNMLKRTASGPREPRHSPKVHVSGEYYLAHGSAGTMPNLAAQSQQDSVYMYQNPVFYGGSGADTSSLPPYLLAPQAAAPPIPYHPHPPLKRWPNDYTVMELSNGFHAMDLLISQSPPGASMTQRAAFERVFGSRYVKSTVCRHRAVWRKAPRGIREQFEQMGTDDSACWGEFVRRVEGRAPAKAVAGGSGGGGRGNSGEASVLGDYHDQQTPSDGDDVHVQEAVMGGIHGQVQGLLE